MSDRDAVSHFRYRIVRLWAVMATLAAVVLGLSQVLQNRYRERSLVSDREGADLKEFEKLRFSREWASRLYTFDSRSYLSTQTATAYMFADPIRQSRLDEIERLAEKVEKSGVSQVGRLVRISKVENGYSAIFSIVLNEGQGKREMQASVFFSLEETERTIENPWGLRVSRFRQTVAPVQPDLPRSALALEVAPRAVLSFPCLVENIEMQKSTRLRVRLTTLDISELEVSARESIQTPMSETVQIQCSETEFLVQVNIVEKELGTVWFQAVDLKDGRKRTDLSQLRRQRKKSPVEATLEEKLGFVTE